MTEALYSGFFLLTFNIRPNGSVYTVLFTLHVDSTTWYTLEREPNGQMDSGVLKVHF